MSDKSYPFPSRTSTYWLDPTTCSYDEAVSMFEAQSDEDKKRNTRPDIRRNLTKPKEEYPYPFPPKTSAYWVANKCSFDEAVRMFEAQSEEDIKRKNNPINSASTIQYQEQQAAQQARHIAHKAEYESSFASPATNSGSVNSRVNNSNQENSLLDETFMLGWHQVENTESQDSMWNNLFTDETPQEKIDLIKSYNLHLNDPVKQGEIVVIPTSEPSDEKAKLAICDLQEEAEVASAALGKCSDDEVVTSNRYFELFDHHILQRIEKDGLPSDYFAYASLGIGVAASGVERHLKNINGILLEINDLYVSKVARASKNGGVNYSAFVAERSTLLKKLDGSFAKLSKRSINIPAYVQVRKNLKLSTKSVIHNANHILKSGAVPNLGKRMANVATGVSTARGFGYIGIGLAAASGTKNIYDACSVNGTGECGKTSSREIAGFGGSLLAGVAIADLAVAGVLLVVGTASAPVVAIATVGAIAIGGAVGGVIGATSGKAVSDIMYEWIEE